MTAATAESASNALSPITVTSLTNGKTYTCTAVATNGIGDGAASTATAPFLVVGVADAPAITSVDLTLNSVTVGFTAGSDGGDPVTAFTVTCDSSDGGTTRSTTDVASPITVSSLDNGNTYTCTVVATNGYGDSVGVGRFEPVRGGRSALPHLRSPRSPGAATPRPSRSLRTATAATRSSTTWSCARRATAASPG